MNGRKFSSGFAAEKNLVLPGIDCAHWFLVRGRETFFMSSEDYLSRKLVADMGWFSCDTHESRIDRCISSQKKLIDQLQNICPVLVDRFMNSCLSARR